MAQRATGDLFVESIPGRANFQAAEAISRHPTWRLAGGLVLPVLRHAVPPHRRAVATNGNIRWKPDEQASPHLHPEAGEEITPLRRSIHSLYPLTDSLVNLPRNKRATMPFGHQQHCSSSSKPRYSSMLRGAVLA